ncbi:peptidase, M50 family protein [Nostoc commune NIES-4072]|uniref:Peptidase, M50 family protein n=1 Tax=Nostoc commune NIES-4072 TaxID=2005467 RepID=A0A2R5FR79_NOSCO|nr:hypothetical protein [Nostoc commune]BBD63966.1 peptidase, M50 family protein [Nostoc commune HK-02]GBG18713.1 peptidase, M50 family protein [Nostoc commune NIES-4072]
MWLVAVFICLGWILSLCLHEFGHALIAYWGGDTSVKDKGYLTLNPLKYTEPSLSLVLPLFFLLIGSIALPTKIYSAKAIAYFLRKNTKKL